MPGRKRRLGRVPFAGRRRVGFMARRRVRAQRRGVRIQRRNLRIGGFAGIEMKFLDTNRAVVSLPVTWGLLDPTTFLGLTSVGEGAGQSQRIGRKFTIHSLHIKGFINMAEFEAQPGPVDDEITRLSVVLDMQTNSAQMVATLVYDSTIGSPVNDFRQLENTHRFKVLKDRTFRLRPFGLNEGAVNSFASQKFMLPFKFNFSFTPPINVMASSTEAVIASMADNSIHLIGVTTVATNTLTYRCRCRFTG